MRRSRPGRAPGPGGGGPKHADPLPLNRPEDAEETALRGRLPRSGRSAPSAGPEGGSQIRRSRPQRRPLTSARQGARCLMPLLQFDRDASEKDLLPAEPVPANTDNRVAANSEYIRSGSHVNDTKIIAGN